MELSTDIKQGEESAAKVSPPTIYAGDVESTDKEHADGPKPESNSPSEPPKLEANSSENDGTSTEVIPDTQSKSDPFAYLDRSYTSEKFKVEIRGLPRFYGFGVSRLAL